MRYYFLKSLSWTFLLLFFTGCGSYFNQPITVESARLGETTKGTSLLQNLPPPIEPVVVGVYKFRDQTGQYKPTEAGSTFSTAVTQGATTILVKALEDSKWFVPIERENLSNLLNERNIIRSTRKEYRKTKNPNEPQLPPLLYAGIILEGGIVSYDSNIITGGAGARYFGIGGATQYRQDRITVYLRAVSTSNGKILKTVYVSKTILSQAIDANLFKYVNFRRLLEAETGFTRNEPGQLAVAEAIEKAVEALVIEGIESNLWKPKSTPEKITKLIATYETEKEIARNTGLYNRFLKSQRGKLGLFAQTGPALISGDYNDARVSYSARLGAKWYTNPYLDFSLAINKFQLRNEEIFDQGFNAFELNAGLTLLPYDRLTPYFVTGFGTINTDTFDQTYFKFQWGGGLEYLITDRLGVSVNALQHIVLSDDVDGVVQGKRDDQYFDFSLGFNWYFNTSYKKEKHLRKQEKEKAKVLKQLKKRNQEIRSKTIK